MKNIADPMSYEVIIARNSAETSLLLPAWTRLQEQEELPDFNAEPDRFLALVSSQKDSHPLIMLLQKQGLPVGMAIGSIEKARIRCTIGYRAFWLPPLRCLTIIHRGLLGQFTDETSEVLLKEIGKLLRSSEADIVLFHYLNTKSPIFKGVAAKTNGLYRSHCNRITVHQTMTVPQSLDAFYLSCSKKHRANLRRYVRRIEEQYAERAVITRYEQEDSVDSFIEVASRVSVKTYQHQLGCGMQCDGRTRNLIMNVAKKGWFRGHVLFLDGEPCAFQYGVVYRGSYSLEQIGFDPKWKDLNVGTVLFLEAMRDLSRDGSGAKVIDFGFGDAEYKRSYGDKSWTEMSFYLFAPRVRPVLANLIYSSTAGLSAGLAHILERTGSIGWIKRRWRNLLRKKGAEHED
jgi:CelD/BcsL family acetyltransferase involved in cellulose biosynthesis